MTEIEPFSERTSPPDDNSSQILKGDGENISLESAAVVSSTILPAHEVTDLQLAEKPPGTCDLNTDDSKRGTKRSREIEPMDHSGSYHLVLMPETTPSVAI
jgi:hypothetical protein